MGTLVQLIQEYVKYWFKRTNNPPAPPVIISAILNVSISSSGLMFFSVNTSAIEQVQMNISNKTFVQTD